MAGQTKPEMYCPENIKQNITLCGIRCVRETMKDKSKKWNVEIGYMDKISHLLHRTQKNTIM
jgi:hypothetical protein